MTSPQSHLRFTPQGWREPISGDDHRIVAQAIRLVEGFYSAHLQDEWLQWARENGVEIAQTAQPVHDPAVRVSVVGGLHQLREQDGLVDVLLVVSADGTERGCLSTYYQPLDRPLLTSRPALVP